MNPTNMSGIAIRKELIQCNYTWKPERKELDGLMMDAGCDPSDMVYIDDMSTLLKTLRGINVSFEVGIVYQWPESTLAGLGTEKAAEMEQDAALRCLTVTNNHIKQRMVSQALAGGILPRQPSVDYGDWFKTIEMPR